MVSLKGRWCVLCVLAVACVSSCSKKEKARKSLRRAESLLVAGDEAWDRGDRYASKAYQEAASLASRVQELLGEDHPLTHRSLQVQELALLKANTCEDPEALVRLVLKVMGEGDSVELKRLILLKPIAEKSLDAGLWQGLSEKERDRWVHCCEIVVERWLQETSDYWRAMQWNTESVLVEKRKATVVMTWLSTLGQAEIHIQCLRMDSGWRLVDFVVPTLNSGLSIYMTEMVREILESHSSFKQFLSREDAERLCVDAFHMAEQRIRTMEQNFVGKRVRLKGQEKDHYDVLDQSRRQDEWWVLLRAEGEESAPSRWIPASMVERVQEEDFLWGFN